MRLQLDQVSKGFVHQTLFEDVSFHIGEDSRIGLIGRNGTGKSTLLKLLMGEAEVDEGTITRSPGLRVGVLTQEPRLNADNTVYAELREVFTALNACVAEEDRLLKALATMAEADQAQALTRVDALHDEMDRLGRSEVDAQIGRLLKGLGFTLEDHQRPVSAFSGGWQMRINLAKVLLDKPDILLLDEPTNHLDLEACEWLEAYLKEYAGGLVIVSHDRRFLDQVCNSIAELSVGALTLWTGNYSAFLAQKAAYMDRLSSAVARQEKQLAKQEAFVERFRASATRSTQAKSREKQLAKVERLTMPDEDNRRMKASFPVPKPSGQRVLFIKGLAKAYGEKSLFSNASAEIMRGQRICLLGANGCGKTTLLRLLLGQEPADAGDIKPGQHVHNGYFSQRQLDTLDPDKTAFETIHDAVPKMTQTEVRGLLGRFLFTREQVFQPVRVLSGGEKSRLALAKLLLAGPNTLFLDEPTNHLDIPAKEVLEEALCEFEGTVLCISHDRFFIQRVATDIWEIHEGQLLVYPGNYDHYLETRNEMRIKAVAAQPTPSLAPTAADNDAPAVAAPTLSPGQQRKALEKSFKQVEREIMTLETALADITDRLSAASLAQDYPNIQALSAQSAEKQARLDVLNAEWETLAEALS